MNICLSLEKMFAFPVWIWSSRKNLLGERLLVESFKFVVKAHGRLVHSLSVSDIGESQPGLQILMIFLFVSELYFRVERALASQAPSPLFLGDDFALDQRLFSEGEFFDLLSLSLVEVFVHLEVGFVPEALETDKFGAVFDISKLFVGSPSDKMIVFKDKRTVTLTLLR